MPGTSSSAMLFVDTCGLASSAEQQRHISDHLEHHYVNNLNDALAHMADHHPVFVLFSVTDPGPEVYEQCAMIECANPAGRTTVVLLVPEDVAAASDLTLPGVVGFATAHTDWAVTVKQLIFISAVASRLYRLEHRTRRMRFATEAFGIHRCTLDTQTGQCRATPSLLNAFGLSESAGKRRSVHRKLLLDKFLHEDARRLDELISGSDHAHAEWKTTCRSVDSLREYDVRGFYIAPTNGMPGHIELLFRDNSSSPSALVTLPQDDSVAGLNSRIHAHAVGSILLVRIENYGSLRDALGYEASKDLLNLAVSRISSSVRSADTVALAQKRDTNIVHIGGEEILVVLDGISSGNLLNKIQARIEQALRQPLSRDNKSIPLRSSIGYATWPEDGYNAGDLLHQAALSIRSASRHAAATYGSTHNEDLDAARQAVRLEADLYDALAKNEMELHFQPKFRLQENGPIVGAEALLRWHRNGKEWIPPNVFIPLAEENGLILSIGRWVIEEAVRCQALWRQEGLGLLPVSVNVSAEQFLQPDFVSHLVHTCASADIPTDAIEIEITESCLIDRPARVIEVLRELKDQGFAIALDDFGTGFSSLSYLRTLPIDTLKIDRSFIQSLDGEEFDPALTAGIIGIGLALGLRIVAEGIETPTQWQLLSNWGCHQGQGFLMARPQPFSELVTLMQSQVEMRA